jgi:flagellar protein FliS
MSLATPQTPKSASRLDGLRSRYKENSSVATPGRAIVLLYDRLLKDFDDATESIRTGNRPAAHEALIHAQLIIEGLDVSLDQRSWSGAPGLRAIYDYVNSQLVTANVSQDIRVLATCRSVIEPLADAWRQAWAELQEPGAATQLSGV